MKLIKNKKQLKAFLDKEAPKAVEEHMLALEADKKLKIKSKRQFVEHEDGSLSVERMPEEEEEITGNISNRRFVRNGDGSYSAERRGV